MDKLWVIAKKEVRVRFTDRRLLLIMIAAPLVISSLIGLAFGNMGRSSSPIQNIPVLIINHDQPDQYGTSFGGLVVSLLSQGQLPSQTTTSIANCPQSTPSQTNSSSSSGLTLSELIHGTVFDAALAQKLINDQTIQAPTAAADTPEFLDEAAHVAVDKGTYSAVVIIPANFSSSLASLTDPSQTAKTAEITIYGNGGRSLETGIVRSVVDTITNQLVNGNIAIGATVAEVASRQPSALANLSKLGLDQLFVCAFAPGNDLVQLSNVPVQAVQSSIAGALLVTFGSAQALFFALFTGQFSILSMYEERRNWTLQRMLASPTPRWAILGGKLVGGLASVFFQLVVLILALTLVGSIIEGHFTFIWGSNLFQLLLVLLAVAVAVSGLGMFLAGILKGVEQANVVGSVLNIALGVLGGAFGFQLPQAISQFSFIFWGRQAFEILASGHGSASINILVLFVEGIVLFFIGLFLFNRKFEI